jgi:predicted PurR-regulated permease PerM
MNVLYFLLQDPSDVAEAAEEVSKEAGQWLYGAGLAGTFAVLIFVAIVFFLLWKKAQTRIDDMNDRLPERLKGLVKELTDSHEGEIRDKNTVITELAQQLRACQEGRLSDSQQVGLTRVEEVTRIETAIINNTTAMSAMQDTLQPLEELMRKTRDLWEWHQPSDASGVKSWICKGDPDSIAKAVRLEMRRRESNEYRRRPDSGRRPEDSQ